MDIKLLIRKYALQNAVKFNGKANAGAVIGKLISEDPKLKEDIKEISKEVKSAVKEINKIPAEKQLKELKKIAPELLEEKKKEEKKVLPPLKNVKGKVIMRFAPSPSGPLHIGHAYVISLNSEYCRLYNGKLILRIEDTNSKNIYPPAYKMLESDAQWITKGNVKEIIIQSDRLGLYYDYAEKLIEMEKAYVCTCNPDVYRDLLIKGIACPCRELPIKEQHTRFDKMFSEYKPGEAVLRIKTDIKHKNPALRDWAAMRINDTSHPRKGTEFRVWPLMNFSVFVDDIETGVTHIIRAKDHMDNAKKQEYLYRYFNKPIPESIFVGRINFVDLKISKTQVKKKIEYGEYSDWDDIRLPFLAALKRRGYQPDAFIKYAIDVGISQADKKVTIEEFFKTINHFNKETIDSRANRYFFIAEPQEVVIEGAPEQTVEIGLHPDYPERGKRVFKTSEKFYLAAEDLKAMKAGRLIRLMDCLNFKKGRKKFVFDSLEYERFKEKGNLIIHWLPVSEDLVNVELLMPDGSIKKGLAENSINKLNEGEICQLERIGFCRLDKKEKDRLVFWFGHR